MCASVKSHKNYKLWIEKVNVNSYERNETFINFFISLAQFCKALRLDKRSQLVPNPKIRSERISGKGAKHPVCKFL